MEEFPKTLATLVQELDVENGILSEFDFTPNSDILSSTSTYISSPDLNIPTVVGNDILDLDYSSSTIFSTSSSVFNGSPDTTTVYLDPWLEIIEQPCEMFRFRYLTESQGTPHGPVMGKNSTKTKRVYPTVRLNNFSGEATIRCWLFTVDDNPGPHVHKLVTKVGQKEIKEEPHDIVVNEHNHYTASFENLVIIHAVRKECYDGYLRKKEIFQSKLLWNHQLRTLDKDARKRLHTDLKQEIKNMNMNIVALYFEALVHNGNSYQKLCDVISRPIKNKKNAEFGDLKIVRADRDFGSVQGGDEIFIFVEKITKDIKIKFYEEDHMGNVIWADYATFSALDIHHLVAIAFRTPPFRDFYISQNVSVKYHLERPNDTSVSNSMNFTYRPSEYRPPLKRAKTSVTQVPDSTSQQLHLDEAGRMSELDKFLCSRMPTASDEFSLSDICVDDSIGFNLPSVLDTDGPLDKIGIELCSTQNEKKELKIQMLESKTVIDGRVLVNKCIKDLNEMNLSESRAREILFSFTVPNGFSSLHWAVALGLEDEFCKLLDTVQAYEIQNFLDLRDATKQTPLHLAVKLGERKFVNKLLEAGADPNLLDTHGNAPIHIGTLFQPLCLESLLKNRTTYVNLKTKDCVNALLLATKHNKVDSLRLLIKSNIDIQSCCGKSGDSALHIAAINSFVHIMDILLENGANVNSQNYAGNTPLHYCVANDNTESVKLLLRYGADPEIRNFITTDRLARRRFVSESDSCDSVAEDLSPQSLGQNVFDLGPSEKILKILKSSSNGPSLRNGVALVHSGKREFFTEDIMGEVCKVLDKNKAWASVAKILGHASLISSMENSPSPSKMLLNYLDVLGDGEDLIENLVQVMKELNITEALQIIGTNPSK